MVTLASDWTDNVGVVGVQFKANGVAVAPEDTTSPYTASWDTTVLANGSYPITVVARDAAGNQGTWSTTLVVNNRDTAQPVVSITSPSDSTVSGRFKIQATATDNDSVYYVLFKIGASQNINSDFTVPYESNEVDVSQYQHGTALTLSAVAYDRGGNTATASINVTVNNPAYQPAPTTLAISNVQVTNTTHNSAVIEWDTNFPANSHVNLAPVGAASFAMNYDNAYVTHHAYKLWGLSPNTTYKYSVDSREYGGQFAQTPAFGSQLSTPAVPPGTDITAPVMSNIQPSGILPAGTRTATISIETDEPATCRYYQGAVTYDKATAFANTGGTMHTTPISVSDGASVYLYTWCADAAGNMKPSHTGVSFSVARPSSFVGGGSVAATDNAALTASVLQTMQTVLEELLKKL